MPRVPRPPLVHLDAAPDAVRATAIQQLGATESADGRLQVAPAPGSQPPIALTLDIAADDRGSRVGIASSGAGKDIAAARKPALLKTHGVTVAMLAYDTIAGYYAAGKTKAGSAKLTAATVKAGNPRMRPSRRCTSSMNPAASAPAPRSQSRSSPFE